MIITLNDVNRGIKQNSNRSENHIPSVDNYMYEEQESYFHTDRQ